MTSTTESPDSVTRGLQPTGHGAATGASARLPFLGGQLFLDPRDPMTCAAEFCARNYMKNGTCTLRFHNGSFFLWSGTHYVEADDDTVRSQLYKFLRSAKHFTKDAKVTPFYPNRAKVADVFEALKAFANLPGSVRPPAWLLEGVTTPAPCELIACKNGLLHLPTARLLPHNPAFFNLNVLDFDFDARASQPVQWQKFLRSIWPDDTDAIATLQEILGYFLLGDTRHQKLFMLIGPPRSGKSTIARVVKRLLGGDNVVGPTMSGLAQNFGLAPLVGKRLAIIADARMGSRHDHSAVTERLLSISGEDELTIDRKYRSAWSGRLGTRILILTNELPRLVDSSGALASRFLILRLQISFLGKEDPHLVERLVSELPGILNWALDGLRRLNGRGHFVEPKSSADFVQVLEELSSPIGAFLRDRCVVANNAEALVGRLFQEWRDWCAEQGRTDAGTAQVFGRDLRAALPRIRTTQRRADTKLLRIFIGVRLK